MDNLPNLKLALDMNEMIRVFTEEELSEIFFYKVEDVWKYSLK